MILLLQVLGSIVEPPVSFDALSAISVFPVLTLDEASRLPAAGGINLDPDCEINLF